MPIPFFDIHYLSHESDDYKAQWCMLRAIELGQWPLFVAQPIAPLLLLWVSLEHLAIALIGLTWLWSLIRHKFISLTLAQLGTVFVHLKWVIGIGVGAYLFLQNNYKLAAIAALWPFVTILLQFAVPSTQVGVLQELFADRVSMLKPNERAF